MSELLEVLREKARCLYLSDLRSAAFRQRALETALSLSPDGFSLAQWQEAGRYLLDRTDLPDTVEGVRALLKERLPQD